MIGRSVFQKHRSGLSSRPISIGIVVLIAFSAYSCSIPNLDTPECLASRSVVREFYSFHFGNDMRFSAGGLEARKRFLTPSYYNSLSNTGSDADVFTTNNTDLPRAFRVGKCETIGEGRSSFEVLLFWRDDTRTEQRAIKVETALIADDWLIDRIIY